MNGNTEAAGTSRPGRGGCAWRTRGWRGAVCAVVLAGGGGVETRAEIPAAACTIVWTNLHQRMDGFGASSAWRGDWASWQADMFFTTNSGIGEAEDGTPFPYTGIGLTLLRTRIAPDGTTRETDIMQMARDRGARVWSAPWSPPIAFKDSGTLNGGRFVSRPEHHTAYADQLADYVASMRDGFGVDLYALSMQNEPNISEVYESCEWTSRQIRAFVPYLRAALDARGAVGTRLLLPEPFNWQFAEAADTLDDPVTAAMVDILAAHGYGSSAAAVDARGKALWMTEDSLLEGSDSSMDNGLYWAGRIHEFLTVAEVNAWHYWWLISGNEDGNEGLADSNGVPAKRMYALGQFSRFVRPGSYRMGTSASDGVRVSAYRHLFTGAFAVVAINTNDTEVALTATFDGASASTVTPWVTSASMSLSNQPPVEVADSIFSHTLPARSVVTYAGHGPADTPLSVQVESHDAEGGFAVRVDGPAGPGYALMSSANLVEWTPVLTTHAPTLPTVLIDTNRYTHPLRVYRIELLP